MSIRIAISMGDYNGIGPEVILKSLPAMDDWGLTPVLLGHEHIFKFYADLLDLEWPVHTIINEPGEIEDGIINILEIPANGDQTPVPGQFSVPAGRAAMQAVEEGIRACMGGHTHALVTAPISKEAVNKAGYHIPGHTEFLAEKTGADSYMMILAHEELRVGLVTIHIPVSEIAGRIASDVVAENIGMMHKTLHNDFDITEPRIAVLGLNPHAGDGGIIGTEEIDHITPAITKAESQGINAGGPFPADGFFGNRHYKHFDGILAMYHDQGLVPFKTLSFGGGVNVTAGLPIVRTSPDHGTAFDIAGENEADPSSLMEALKMAMELSQNRHQKKIQ